uniref:RNA polymerase sigma factor n=1 Tax=Meloidogyne hapla TaxID=6305 RepID=A0A1I8BHE4_MELHA
MRAILLTKPIFLATEMIKFIKNPNGDKLRTWIYDVRINFFLQLAATQSLEDDFSIFERLPIYGDNESWTECYDKPSINDFYILSRRKSFVYQYLMFLAGCK